MGKAVLEHNDSQASVLSYGTEDLAGYRELPQTTTRQWAETSPAWSSCQGVVPSPQMWL